jgi:TonB family protein
VKLLRLFAAVICWSLASLAFALPQNDAAHTKRVRIEPNVAAALLTNRVEPAYPESALADHVSGAVLLHIVIDPQGKVIEAAPVSRDEWPPNLALAPPSLVLTEDPRLREAAVKAVKQWEYLPYRPDGQPVEVETRVVVKFKTEPSAGGGVIGVPNGVGGVPGGVRGSSGGVIGGIVGSAAPPPKVATPQKVRVSSEVMEGNLLTHVDPVYPSLARKAQIQGEVRLQATISKTGAIENLRAVSGHPILIQAAMDAVRQWKYKPFLLNGEPTEVEGTVIVVFKL